MNRDALTLDLGNSSAKLVRWSAGGLRFNRVDWESNWRARMRALLSEFLADSAIPILLSSVVDGNRREELVAICAEFQNELFVNPEPKLIVECREPDRVGRDRLYAALGASLLSGESTIVVDAGTALTVDAVKWRPKDSNMDCPHFLGGAIGPGPVLLARSLSEGGAQLFEVDIDRDVPALGRDTAQALRAGVCIGFQGMARELVNRIRLEAGLQGAPVCLTGGARNLLTLEHMFGDGRLFEEEHLVHRGLLACLGDA